MSSNGTGPASSRDALRDGVGVERDVTVLDRAEEVRLTMRLRELRREAEQLEATAAQPPDPGAAVSELRVRLGRLLAQRQRLHAEELLQAEARAAATVAAGRAEAERVLESRHSEGSLATADAVVADAAPADAVVVDAVVVDAVPADAVPADAASAQFDEADEVDTGVVDPFEGGSDTDALDAGSGVDSSEFGEEPNADRRLADDVVDSDSEVDSEVAVAVAVAVDTESVDEFVDSEIEIEIEIEPESVDLGETSTVAGVADIDDIAVRDVEVDDVPVAGVPVPDVGVDAVVEPAEPTSDRDDTLATSNDGRAEAGAATEEPLIGDRLLYGDNPIEAALLGATDIDARVLDRRRVALTRLVRSISDESVLVAPTLVGAEGGAGTAPSLLAPTPDVDVTVVEHVPTRVMPLVASAVTSPWAPPTPGSQAASVDARPPALPEGPLDAALRDVAERHVAVNLDAEEFAAALAAALAPILAQRAPSMPPGQYRPVSEAPTSFWANAKHVDVVLAFVALSIVLAVLFAWML